MYRQLAQGIQKVVVCPQCNGYLKQESNGDLYCLSCNALYEWTEFGNIDLRLKTPKNMQLVFQVGKPLLLEDVPICDSLTLNPLSQLTFTDIVVPNHLSRELLSYFPKATGKHSLMLDLGCGDTTHREVCEYAGFEYVGLDYENHKAPILGDAHALPFKDESFEFMLSVAVLEHIQFPFVMMQEAFRILKPGGSFVGTVAFLEPFHGNSFYHHTHLGLFYTLQYGGFDVERIAANDGWSVFDAQARMAAKVIFPRMPKPFSTAFIRFPRVMQNLWWGVGRIFKSNIKRHKNTQVFAGSFSFVAKKRIAP